MMDAEERELPRDYDDPGTRERPDPMKLVSPFADSSRRKPPLPQGYRHPMSSPLGFWDGVAATLLSLLVAWVVYLAFPLVLAGFGPCATSP